MVTIKDVAKKAKVSIGTVSNVINNLETVSDKNKKKVLETIKELRYRHNKVAASLMKKKTSNIGLIVPDISSPYYSDLIKGIYRTLEHNGFNVFLSGSGDSVEKEEKIIEDLLSSWIDGIILVPAYSNDREIEYINNIEVPMVIVNRELMGINKDLVVFDNFGGSYKAMNYLIGNDHEDIVVLAGPEYSISFENRLMGCKQALEEKNLYNDGLVFHGDYSAESGYKCMKDALKNINSIDAVFASSDMIAFGAIKAIIEKGLRIPDDISLIGFGDIYLSKYINPPLTTVKRPFYEIGKISVEVLLKRISGSANLIPERVVVGGDLEIRNSVTIKSFYVND